MFFANQQGKIGNPAISLQFVADSVQRMENGLILSASDPFWGTGEFMYVKASGGCSQFGLVALLPVYNATTMLWEMTVADCPSTANLGQSVGVSMSAMVAGQWGWVCIGGTVPVAASASVAAGTTFGIGTAGKVGANSAGKQILNARAAAPSATTVVRTGVGDSGSKIVKLNSADGFFVGAAVSGTGIAGGATVAAIDPDNRTITLSAANTAQVNGSVTATYTGFEVVHINRPFAQGAIT